MFIQITELSTDGETHLPTLLNLDSVESFRVAGTETIITYKQTDENGENYTAISVTSLKVIQEKLKEINLIK